MSDNTLDNGQLESNESQCLMMLGALSVFRDV